MRARAGAVAVVLVCAVAAAAQAAPRASTGHQRSLQREVALAKARFAVNRKRPHPGKPEALTHPAADHAGVGVGAHTGVAPTPLYTARSRVAPRTASSSVPGMDVSGYQGNVDWSQAAANGAQFAQVKATEGTSYTNSYFAQQYDGSYAAGLERGAYHFATPSNSTGAAQADYFVAHGGGWSPDGRTTPGELDIEYNPYSGGECYGLSPSQMIGWVDAFSDEYRSLTGRWPMVYSTTDWWTTCTGNYGGDGHDPLWIANYNGSPGPLPNGWSTYTFWQYADHGTYPGDQDVFNGDHAALVSFAQGAPPPAPPPDRTAAHRWVGRDLDGRLEAFVVGPNGHLLDYYQRAPGSSFVGPVDLAAGPFAGPPAVGSNADGRLEVFATDSQTHDVETAYQRTPGGAFTAFRSMGQPDPGATGTGTPVAIQNADGRLEVFVRDTNGGVGTRFQTRPNGGFEPTWHDLGGRVAGTPATGNDADGRIELFARDADGGGVTNWYQHIPNGAIVGPSHGLPGGQFTSDPAVGLNADGRLQVFVRHSDGDVWTAAQRSAGSGYGGWSAMGAAGGQGNPTVTANQDGRLEVFARNGGTGISTSYQTSPNGPFSRPWSDLKGRTLQEPSPDATLDVNGRIALFAISTGQQLVTKAQGTPNGSFPAAYTTLGPAY